jgi:hypothetical protein
MRLLTLGQLQLESASLTRPKPLLLLAYLNLEGIRARRDVAALFWGGIKDPMQGLRVALVQINKDAPKAVQSDQYRVWSELETDLSQMCSAFDEQRFEAGLSLYQGPFLDGLDTSSCNEELEEWIWQTRERVADRVRGAHLALAERAAAAGDHRRAAQHAEAAYLLRAAPEPTLRQLEHFHRFFQAAGSVHAEHVAREAKTFGVHLDSSPEVALTQTPEPSANEQTSSVPMRFEPQAVIVLEPNVKRDARAAAQSRSWWRYSRQGLLLTTIVGAFLTLGLASALVLLARDDKALTIANDALNESDNGDDDVDVGLGSNYFCPKGGHIYLSTTYKDQSTAIRFRNVKLSKGGGGRITIQKAILVFAPSTNIASVTRGGGFKVYGLFDARPWPSNPDCKAPKAQDYKSRGRTIRSVLHTPSAWLERQAQVVDVTAIVQEIVQAIVQEPGRDTKRGDDGFAFAIDKLPDSTANLRAFSFESGASDVKKRPKLSITYTVKP